MDRFDIEQCDRQEYRRRIEEHAEVDLKDHRVELKAYDPAVARWMCKRPGSWTYGFNVVVWPGAIVIQGDVGEAMFSCREPTVQDALAWLRGAVDSRDYLLGKLMAGSRDRVLIWPFVENELADMSAEDAARFREAWAELDAPDGRDYGRLMYELFGDTEGGCTDFGFRALWLAACLKRFMVLHDETVKEEVPGGNASV